MKKIIFIILISIFLLSNCNKNHNNKIPIGAILPLTGTLSSYGKWTKDGIELAKEEINLTRKKNNKKEIEILYSDSRSRISDAVSGLQKLLQNKEINVVIGELASGFTLAMAPIAERQKKILFSPASSSPDITNAGDYIFRNWPSDNYEGKIMAKYLINSGINNIGIIGVNNEFALGIISVFEEYFYKSGGKIKIKELVNEGQIDYSNSIQRFKNRKIQAIYIVGYAKEVGLIIKALKEFEINTPLYSTSSAENELLIKMLGDKANGLIYSAPAYDPNSKDEHVSAFVEKFKQKYGYIPPINSATGYDALMIINYAIEKVGNNAKRIKDFLYQLKDFPGVSGKTSFDKNGDVQKEVFLKRIVEKKFVILENKK